MPQSRAPWFHRDRAEYWAFIAQIAGSIGVIVSVVYLGVQINGSVNELKTQTHYNALTLAQRPLELLMSDQELSEIVEVGMRDPESLKPAEWLRFSNYHLSLFNAWEYIYLLDRSGSIPEALSGGADSYFRNLVAEQPGVRKFWSEGRVAFVDPFLTYADKVVKDADAAAITTPPPAGATKE